MIQLALLSRPAARLEEEALNEIQPPLNILHFNLQRP
jgi:hypothetical protein